MVNVTSGYDIFENMLSSIKYDPKELGLYTFFVRVGVIKYRPPRHEFFDFIREIGSSNLEPVLYQGHITNPEQLIFVFPERHLSVHEQRILMPKLKRHSQVGKIKSVDIITSSPLIIGDFLREMLTILTWPDDEENL